MNSNLFQKTCRNKDYNQKLEAAIAMAHKAEQINIQVGKCSAHMLGPIQSKGNPLLLPHSRELVAIPIAALILELVLSLLARCP